MVSHNSILNMEFDVVILFSLYYVHLLEYTQYLSEYVLRLTIDK